jgi:hypothetical protein
LVKSANLGQGAIELILFISICYGIFFNFFDIYGKEFKHVQKHQFPRDLTWEKQMEDTP